MIKSRKSKVSQVYGQLAFQPLQPPHPFARHDGENEAKARMCHFLVAQDVSFARPSETKAKLVISPSGGIKLR